MSSAILTSSQRVAPSSAPPTTRTGPNGPGVTALSVVGLEFSLRTASLDELETVARAVTKARTDDWLARLEGTEEVARLSTCHRVELVLLVRDPEVVDRWREVLPGTRSSWRFREGRELVHHLFRVAAGRESLAVGEAEVRAQVRAASLAVGSRHPRPVLRELLRAAAVAAETVAPTVPASRSIASVAATRLLEIVGRPFPRVLVVGSGTVGRQVAESLAPSARLTIAFHERPPDERFLRATGARAVRLDRLSDEIALCDAVVTAAKFGQHPLGTAEFPRDRPLVLVDLGVPRNIDPGVRARPNICLVDLGELHALSDRFRRTDDHDLRIRELAERFSDRFELLLLEPWVGAFRRRAEAVRRSELALARRFLGALDPDQELAVDRLTRRLVARLLLPPTERIRSLPAGPDADLLRRVAVELLRPDAAGP